MTGLTDFVTLVTAVTQTDQPNDHPDHQFDHPKNRAKQRSVGC